MLEGKDRSLDTSASTETQQTAAALRAISKGLRFVNKPESCCCNFNGKNLGPAFRNDYSLGFGLKSSVITLDL